MAAIKSAAILDFASIEFGRGGTVRDFRFLDSEENSAQLSSNDIGILALLIYGPGLVVYTMQKIAMYHIVIVQYSLEIFHNCTQINVL